jgi:hypothetical protein
MTKCFEVNKVQDMLSNNNVMLSERRYESGVVMRLKSTDDISQRGLAK